jgi:hypothetical protein
MTYNISLPEVLSYNGVEVRFAELTEAEVNRTVDYLIKYGFGKSLQDSVAGLKKKLESEGELDADEITAKIAEEMESRADAIVNGTIGTRAPRGTSEDKIRRDVIASFFKAYLAKTKQALPKLGKDATASQKEALAKKIAQFHEQYYAANKAKVDEEVARRIEAQKEESEAELDLDLDFNLDAA